MTDFNLRAVACGSSSSLILSGDADLAVADEIVHQGTTLLGSDATRSLVIDLGEVTFIDSTTLGALVRLRNSAIASNKQLRLARLPTRVRRLFQIAGLAGVFEEAQDEQHRA